MHGGALATPVTMKLQGPYQAPLEPWRKETVSLCTIQTNSNAPLHSFARAVLYSIGRTYVLVARAAIPTSSRIRSYSSQIALASCAQQIGVDLMINFGDTDAKALRVR